MPFSTFARSLVNNCSASELIPIIKKIVPCYSTTYSDEWKAYDDIVNAGYKKALQSYMHGEDIFANGRAPVS